MWTQNRPSYENRCLAIQRNHARFVIALETWLLVWCKSARCTLMAVGRYIIKACAVRFDMIAVSSQVQCLLLIECGNTLNAVCTLHSDCFLLFLCNILFFSSVFFLYLLFLLLLAVLALRHHFSHIRCAFFYLFIYIFVIFVRLLWCALVFHAMRNNCMEISQIVIWFNVNNI